MYNQLCWKEELWEAAKDEEMKIPWKEAKEGPPERNCNNQCLWAGHADQFICIIQQEYEGIGGPSEQVGLHSQESCKTPN